MGIFSKAKEVAASVVTDDDAEREEVHADLEAQAQALVPEILAEQPARAEAFKAAHEADCAGYSFSVTRFGTFLSVHISRTFNPNNTEERGWPGIHPRQYAETFVPMDFHLVEGNVPDMGGKVEFGFNGVPVDGVGAMGCSGMGNFDPGPNYKWVVYAKEPQLPYSRPLLFTEPVPEKSVWITSSYGGGGYRIQTAASPTARIAEDDRIVFGSIRKTIYAPAGMGKMVLDKVHAALARET